MAEPAIVLQLPSGDLEARPVTAYAEKWGEPGKPVERKTLNAWCASGKVPGAHHGPDGKWWVYPIMLMGIDLSALQSTKERHEKIKGHWIDSPDPRKVQSTLDDQRKARIR